MQSVSMDNVHLTVCALLFSFVAIVHVNPVSAGDGGIEKPGSCPPVSWFGPPVQCHYHQHSFCSSDFHCPGKEKCCKNRCGNVCVAPHAAPTEKPGVCPRQTAAKWKPCAGFSKQKCTCDQDCPGKLKCCNTGCGPICVKPAAVEKPGVCPRKTQTDWNTCSWFPQHNCTCDQDCPGTLKCCDSGCGPTCVKPVSVEKPGVCPRRRTKVDWNTCSRFSEHKCTCDQDCPGPFKCCDFGCGPTCVKPVSVEKPGVCPRRRTKVDWNTCSRFSEHKCTCDQDCPGPFKCCDFGCGPTCVKPVSVEKPGVCPRRRTKVDWNTCSRFSEHKCTCDQDCPGPFKCCDFGCGPTCVKPATVEKPGVCPRKTQTDWNTCSWFPQHNCTCDQDCPGPLKCCDSGCGPSCVKPVSVEKPGVCPRRRTKVDWNTCSRFSEHKCTCDQDCPGPFKCCDFGCGPTCVKPATVPTDNPGLCPDPVHRDPRWCASITQITCSCDQDCGKVLKCCNNGCGPTCVNPVLDDNPPPPVENPGTCPAPTHRDPLWCAKILHFQSRCTCDQDCGKTLKCCNTGCGPTCVEPVLADNPPPKAENPGTCPAPIYRDPRWCASITQITCSCDQDCGKVLKCCNNGCGPTCVNPVLDDNPPPPAENPGTCPAPTHSDPLWCSKILQFQLRCTCDQDCGKTLKCCNTGCGPTCVEPVLDDNPPTPVENPGTCPAPTHRDPLWCAKILHFQSRCTCDQDCGKTLKCCNTGCGPTCVEPVFANPGVCPKPSGFGICIQECNNDFECGPHQKCCSNGCGHVCMEPLKGY